jgi:pantetheine-phosphate adenylyltransferase
MHDATKSRFREPKHLPLPSSRIVTMSEALNPRRAVYVGSFDPLTLGHLDIIRRGARLFEKLTVGIGVNPEKRPLFSTDERLALTKSVLADLPNVDVACFEGLAVNFALEQNAAVMLRGIRTLTDIEAEFTMSLANRVLAREIETVFLMSSEKYTHISSSLIKQIAQLGGAERLQAFVPAEIIPGLVAKYQAGRG